ncbi:MAG TPA: amidohydrolase [Chryseolinea sp.]
MNKFFLGIALALVSAPSYAQVSAKLQTKIDADARQLESKVIEWRRHFHQFPELSNREFNTGAKIASYLKSFGLEVQYPVAKTGVVAILKGAKPGPVVALRADMDALPVTERSTLEFASKEKTLYAGKETGVMHACGHDGHMAILLGVAELLSKYKNELKGTVKFVFQPAEEGAPFGEEGGAQLMIKEGVLNNPDVDVMFGLHIQALLPSGQLLYRTGGLMAAVDGVNIKVTGIGAHGASPWESIDPIVVSSQIINALQTIVSRQTDLTAGAAVVTIGTIHAGVRRNIIPEEALLEGTIRTFDKAVQKRVHEQITRTATKIAEASGAKAEVDVQIMYPATINDPQLAQLSVPSLMRTVGKEKLVVTQPVTMAEDFSFYQQKIPAFFFFLGARPDIKLDKQPVHHTADFLLDEKALITGVRALTNLTLDYLFVH